MCCGARCGAGENAEWHRRYRSWKGNAGLSVQVEVVVWLLRHLVQRRAGAAVFASAVAWRAAVVQAVRVLRYAMVPVS